MDNVDRQVRYFLKVAELSSLSKAAEALDLTQSGLSRQVAGLEAHLGKPLFLRTGRGVELTEAGRSLKEQAEPAYASIDAALESVRLRDGITRGTVRLACVHTLSYYFMGEVAARFVSQHEGVNLFMLGRSSPEVVDLVEAGKADAGLVYDTAVASSAVTLTPLFDDDMCLVVQGRSELSGTVDLTAGTPPLVGFPAPYALRRMLHSGGLEPTFVAEAETVDAMLKLVSSGIGACVLPLRMPDKLLAEYDLRKVTIRAPLLRRRVVAIVRSDRAPTRLVKDLVDTALAVSRY
jgi:DNA-binding transcriptional LysR family regulator